MVSDGAVKYFEGMGVFESLEVVRTWQNMFFFLMGTSRVVGRTVQ
jgi:hypothetical protein